MLRRKEFAELAQRINRDMGWQFFGLELLTYALVTLVTPPFAAHLMVSILALLPSLSMLLIKFSFYSAESIP